MAEPNASQHLCELLPELLDYVPLLPFAVIALPLWPFSETLFLKCDR